MKRFLSMALVCVIITLFSVVPVFAYNPPDPSLTYTTIAFPDKWTTGWKDDSWGGALIQETFTKNQPYILATGGSPYTIVILNGSTYTHVDSDKLMKFTGNVIFVNKSSSDGGLYPYSQSGLNLKYGARIIPNQWFNPKKYPELAPYFTAPMNYRITGCHGWINDYYPSKPPDPVVSGISLHNSASKTSYYEGDPLDLTGLSVYLSHSDGSTKDIPFSEFGANKITVSPANSTILNTTNNKVTITCNGYSVNQPIAVTKKPPSITDVLPKLPPTKTEYTEGDKLDLTGLSVTLTMDDNSTTDIPFTDFPAHSITASPPHDSILTVDQKEITVSCKSFAFKIPITVHEKVGPVDHPGPDEPNPDYVMFPESVRKEFLEYISGDIANIFNFSLILFFMLLTVFLLAHIIKHYII